MFESFFARKQEAKKMEDDKLKKKALKDALRNASHADSTSAPLAEEKVSQRIGRIKVSEKSFEMKPGQTEAPLILDDNKQPKRYGYAKNPVDEGDPRLPLHTRMLDETNFKDTDSEKTSSELHDVIHDKESGITIVVEPPQPDTKN